MLRGYRFRLDPTESQEQILLQWIGGQRLIYNVKVQEDRYCRRFARRLVGAAGVPVPVDQQDRQFITDRTAFLREIPSQILRHRAVESRQAYQRYFRKLGGRPKLKRQTGRQSVWLTSELFHVIPVASETTGNAQGYQLRVGTVKFPVGIIPYVAHRCHAVPSSLHMAVEGDRWWLSLAAEDPTVTMPGRDADAATQRIAEDLRHRPVAQLAERSLDGDRGIAKPVTTADGPVFDLPPVQKTRIRKHRRHDTPWHRKAAQRKKRSKNQKKAYRHVARFQQYAANVRRESAQRYVFEDLRLQPLTKRPKVQRDADVRFLPNGRKAKAGLNRAILASVWGQVLEFTRYKALRTRKLVIPVPPAYSSQEYAVSPFTSPGHRLRQAEFVCQRCGHRDNAHHNAGAVIVRRGIHKRLSGDRLTNPHNTTRIFRRLGPERSEITPGQIPVRRRKPLASVHRSTNQESPGAIRENPRLNP